jgi:3-hydroxyacyl-CoA dehydrogenase / enoyl-CoA hydratase / 3-hydroxybutyryl-CoA epimerase / enoyl-CoA isomerase
MAMLYEAISLVVKEVAGGFAELIFHAPGSVNKLDRQTLQGLSEAVTRLEQRPDLRGLLITSAKPHFIVGADITEFFALFALPEHQLAEWLTRINQLFCRIEALPYPTLAMLQGHTLGGGCELALAADYRIADDSLQIGLPETRLGIMPGWGGTVRLPRIIGCDNAANMIAQARELDCQTALRLGIVDATASAEDLRLVALRMLEQAATNSLNWRARRLQKQSPLPLSDIEARIGEQTALAHTHQLVGAHYPAPLQAIQTLYACRRMSQDVALIQERQDFINLTRTPQAQALVGNFLNEQLVKNKAKALAAQHNVHSAAVLGAGIMGGGIAYQSASRGIPVRLKDIRSSALQQGMTEVTELLGKALNKGAITVQELSRTLQAVTPTLSDEGFDSVELVVEAVVENLVIKRQVLAETELQLPAHGVLTSNTSTIPISELASALHRPESFCGMHFFNPVPKMLLVEIIRGTQTSEETIGRVTAYALTLGKLPIIVHDGPGFFVNRVLFAYFIGFRLLLAEGQDPYRIDQVMERRFGWPMGPARLLDVIGLDTAHHAAQVMAQGFPERMAPDVEDPVAKLYAAGHLGQKNQKGFYLYQTDARGKLTRQPDPELTASWLPAAHQTPPCSDEEIERRMMIPLLTEVVRCLEEGIIATPAEADIALLYGLGFPPFRGGPCRYLEQLGIAQFVQQADQHAALGSLYSVVPLLRNMAVRGGHFYPGAQHA